MNPEALERAYEWYTSGPRQRLQPGGAIVVVMTRWNQKDLTGKLLNAQSSEKEKIIPFSKKVQEMVEALASQAAVAITNKNLIKDLEALFESFIKLIASAIDEKSPYTGGHCARVPEITMMLANAVHNTDYGPFAKTKFSEKELYELKIAAWLHDCGKVATPEFVVDKSTKLETIYDRINEVGTRFVVLHRDAEIEKLNKELKIERNESLSFDKKQQEIKKLNVNMVFDTAKVFAEEARSIYEENKKNIDTSFRNHLN